MICQTYSLLPLLDFGSKTTVVTQACVVHPSSINSGFLGNRYMGPGQTLWQFPVHHISKHIFLYTILFSNKGPYAKKIQEATPTFW